MKLSVLLFAALAGYQYEFPADHFNHPAFQTEWWYYTGNLHDSTGHRYGFELTFFRQANVQQAEPTAWSLDQLYLAHLALTDIDNHAFYHDERLNRAGPGLAGIETGKYWNGNWRVTWTNLNTAQQTLEAVCDKFSIKLDLAPLKPLVIHGINGITQKGPAPGESSHYLSFTRLSAQGQVNNTTVSGLAWMDHEFFTWPSTSSEIVGWDWFAVQLENNEELMLYRLRKNDGSISPYSSGSYIDAQGAGHHLTADQISYTPTRVWKKYPIDWQISIPTLGLALKEQSALDNQELSTSLGLTSSYWEGAVTYQGAIHQQPTHGVGYLELTGYAQPVFLGH